MSAVWVCVQWLTITQQDHHLELAHLPPVLPAALRASDSAAYTDSGERNTPAVADVVCWSSPALTSENAIEETAWEREPVIATARGGELVRLAR